MTGLENKLVDAQKFAMSIRPKVGGFPVLAEALRQAGVKMNRWNLPSCQSIYHLEAGVVVQQGNPLVIGTHEIPKFNREALIEALRTDQKGLSTFPEFLAASWKAGVVGYDVDFEARKVSYFGSQGEVYIEDYPAVDLSKI